jgi:hypothetical protein
MVQNKTKNKVKWKIFRDIETPSYYSGGLCAHIIILQPLQRIGTLALPCGIEAVKRILFVVAQLNIPRLNRIGRSLCISGLVDQESEQCQCTIKYSPKNDARIPPHQK